MNRRLQQFLDLENLSPARLADMLGVQRSNISHILSGRNNPSYDFIKAVLTKFPQLSAEWFLTGKGKPYKEMNNTSTPAQENFTTPAQVAAQNFPQAQTQVATQTQNFPQAQSQVATPAPIQSQGQIFTQAKEIVHATPAVEQISQIPTQDDEDLFSFEEIVGQNEKNLLEEERNGQIQNFSANSQNIENNTYNTRNELVTGILEQEQPRENQKIAQSRTSGSQKRSVKKVIILYNDGSFEEFHPSGNNL